MAMTDLSPQALPFTCSIFYDRMPCSRFSFLLIMNILQASPFWSCSGRPQDISGHSQHLGDRRTFQVILSIWETAGHFRSFSASGRPQDISGHSQHLGDRRTFQVILSIWETAGHFRSFSASGRPQDISGHSQHLGDRRTFQVILSIWETAGHFRSFSASGRAQDISGHSQHLGERRTFNAILSVWETAGPVMCPNPNLTSETHPGQLNKELKNITAVAFSIFSAMSELCVQDGMHGEVAAVSEAGDQLNEDVVAGPPDTLALPFKLAPAPLLGGRHSKHLKQSHTSPTCMTLLTLPFLDKSFFHLIPFFGSIVCAICSTIVAEEKVEF
ncbi:uncharacterized protein LOC125712292 isoform X2 [Brienomyrus brachyistius]|uniref:uncharacterized protein LOC125712292 isoform X1 n=1 Tax=Brienomyrus brachyistius TaxID=42636 RepID=UPI0020B1985C|nr:uncharacterized protein LOC125712292 isoform X1 [Brienomyrus brachyistius]XP_048838164.1 uncharacterized protein LOC125712292 isoform X2 [Brienomyrus brachyistius]XP_048838165.1 uncharacterized protein LOC125712292 isoform X2 [Brienomyrus brachyistius]